MNIQVRDYNEERKKDKKNLIEAVTLLVLAIILFILGLVWINMELDRMVGASNLEIYSAPYVGIEVNKPFNSDISEPYDIQPALGYGALDWPFTGVRGQ